MFIFSEAMVYLTISIVIASIFTFFLFSSEKNGAIIASCIVAVLYALTVYLVADLCKETFTWNIALAFLCPFYVGLAIVTILLQRWLNKKYLEEERKLELLVIANELERYKNATDLANLIRSLSIEGFDIDTMDIQAFVKAKMRKS